MPPAPQEDIEARLRRVEDLLEIHQLFVDYGRHLDRGDFAAFAGLFATDGEILLGPIGRAKGRPEVQALMEATLGGSVGETVHVISSPAVALDGTETRKCVPDPASFEASKTASFGGCLTGWAVMRFALRLLVYL